MKFFAVSGNWESITTTESSLINQPIVPPRSVKIPILPFIILKFPLLRVEALQKLDLLEKPIPPRVRYFLRNYVYLFSFNSPV